MILSLVILVVYLGSPYGPESLVPLPGLFGYTDLYYDHGAISPNIVPPPITGLWWNDNFIISENKDIIAGKKWYILDLNKTEKTICNTYDEFRTALKRVSLSPEDIRFCKGDEIRGKREKELGFKLNKGNFRKFQSEKHKEIIDKLRREGAALDQKMRKQPVK